MNKILTKCDDNKLINPKTGRCVEVSQSDIVRLINAGYKIKENKSIKPVKPSIPDKSDKFLYSCGVSKLINPKTGKCVHINNTNFNKLIKAGYKIIELSVKPIQPCPTSPKPLPKPRKSYKRNIIYNSNKVIDLISCGKNMIINPFSGKCVLINGPTGKKLMSMPHKLIYPDGIPKAMPKIIKQKKIDSSIELDTDGDGYVSIKEYLATKQSLGDDEKEFTGAFNYYNEGSFGIRFLLTLIKNKTGAISKIACIPDYLLCLYKDKNYNTYVQNSNNGKCLYNNDKLISGGYTNQALIGMENVPIWDDNSKKIPRVWMPPNFVNVIKDLTWLIKYEQAQKNRQLPVFC